MTPEPFDLYGELKEFFLPVLFRATGVDNPVTDIYQIQTLYTQSGFDIFVFIIGVDTGNGEQNFCITMNQNSALRYVSFGGNMADGKVYVNGELQLRHINSQVERILEGNDYVEVTITSEEKEGLERLLTLGKGTAFNIRQISYE